MNSFINTVVGVLSLFLCLNFVNGKSVCTDQQLTEAQRAFRNCVESAKAGIVSTHGNEVDEELVCKSLENMLAGCDSQVSTNTINARTHIIFCFQGVYRTRAMADRSLVITALLL